MKQGHTVDLTYTGYLVTGSKFGNMFECNVNRESFKTVIGSGDLVRGCEEGLLGMKRGGKRIIVVNPHLGFGKAASTTMPDNSMLIFEVFFFSFSFNLILINLIY